MHANDDIVVDVTHLRIMVEKNRRHGRGQIVDSRSGLGVAAREWLCHVVDVDNTGTRTTSQELPCVRVVQAG